MNEEEFRKMALDKGYGEQELYEVGPGPEEEMHAHDYSVMSLVLSGEFTMTTEKGTKIFKAGDWCENPAGTLHKERTGPEGGAFLAAKK